MSNQLHACLNYAYIHIKTIQKQFKEFLCEHSNSTDTLFSRMLTILLRTRFKEPQLENSYMEYTSRFKRHSMCLLLYIGVLTNMSSIAVSGKQIKDVFICFILYILYRLVLIDIMQYKF